VTIKGGLGAAFFVALAAVAGAPAPATSGVVLDIVAAVRGWRRPTPPFRIAERLYYVGTADLAAYLITSNDGLILLDGTLPETAGQVLGNVRTLGFDPRQIRILLNSHAHFDHAGGLAEIKRATGAALVASDKDAELLERGGRGDFFFGDRFPYPAVKVDRRVEDQGVVELGGTRLVAHLTPGHTRGCTSWTGTFEDRGHRYSAVFVCSLSVVPGYRLKGRPSYPGIARDYRGSVATLKALPCELFLGAHARFFDMARKRAALIQRPASNPFVDPDGCRAYLRDSEASIEARLR
jgi:metallo-beta-lactamase class B